MITTTPLLGKHKFAKRLGHAKYYAEMQWLMLQQETPEDFVISTGEQHSVRDFVELAVQTININWKGEGIDKKVITPKPKHTQLQLIYVISGLLKLNHY